MKSIKTRIETVPSTHPLKFSSLVGG